MTAAKATPAHTTGPWTADGQGGYERKRNDGSPWRSLNIGLADGTTIAEVCIPKGGNWDHETAKANAARIVACVNACEGLDSEDLADMTFYAQCEEMTRLRAENARLRDALQNALNVLAGVATGDLATVRKDSPAIAQARAALGGQA